MSRASLDGAGGEGNNSSVMSTVSASGRFIAFESYASNFVPGDTNSALDIYIKDRLTGVMERVSVDSAGNQPNSFSTFPAVSAEGRFVAFVSRASNLVAGDSNGQDDVFVRDRLLGTTVRVSVTTAGGQANGASIRPAISGDGRIVAFESYSTNLVASDTNGRIDVFAHELATGITTRVSVGPGGVEADFDSRRASLSADGRFLAFDSGASNLVAGDANGAGDVFLLDRTLGTLVLVSRDAAGNQASLGAGGPKLSGDAIHVAFWSQSPDLVPGDTNGLGDVFVKDLATGAVDRATVSSSGVEADNFTDAELDISDDGRFVVFESNATNLVPGDINSRPDVFLHDRVTGTTTLASPALSSAGANQSCRIPRLSGDGTLVTFQSWATNLVAGDTNSSQDVFAWRPDLTLDAQPLFPVAGETLQFATFHSTPGNLVLLQWVESNGVPLDLVLAIGFFDASGQWSVGFPYAGGLAGNSIGVRSLGIASSGALAISGKQTVYLR